MKSHRSLKRHDSVDSFEPIELATTTSVARLLCVLGRLLDHNDFLERAISACGANLVWTEEVLIELENVASSASDRHRHPHEREDSDGEQFSGPVRKKSWRALAQRWSALVDPLAADAIESGLFRALNRNSTLRRRVGRATLDVLQAGQQPEVPALRNAKFMADAFDLGDAGRQLIELMILCELNSTFEQALSELEFGKRHEVERVLSLYLGCEQRATARLLARDGLMARIGLIAPDECSTSVGSMLSMGGSLFTEVLASPHESMEAFLESFLSPSAAPRLHDEDTAHLAGVKQLVVPVLANAAKAGVVGINVMLHGAPGTGKTEFARHVARQAGLRLFEVRCATSMGACLSPAQRIASLLLTLQALKGKRDVAVLLDEAEDVFSRFQPDLWLPAPSADANSKAWITRLLEETLIPVLWTSNRVSQIDPAILRRFAFIYEFGELPRSVRLKMAHAYMNDLGLPEQRLEQVAALGMLAPSQLENAARTVALAEPQDALQAWQLVRLQLDESRRALGHAPLAETTGSSVPYDPTWLNLRGHQPGNLVQGLQARGRASLCFHGQAGTGKTQLAHHLARELDRELLSFSASDLLSKWVGETERRIARMFRDAGERADQVLLLLDEADTFLRDRARATTSWELSHTNEFLARMEGFPGIFICTTNLPDTLDTAILRRFKFRIEFQGMQASQALALFPKAFGRVATAAETKAINDLDGMLAPADFANVAQQLEFAGGAISEVALIERLVEECKARGATRGIRRPIGFVHQTVDSATSRH